MPAQILDGGQGGGLDVGVTAGSLTALHGDAIALGRHRAERRARPGRRARRGHARRRVPHACHGRGDLLARAGVRGRAASRPSSPPATRPRPLLGTVLVQGRSSGSRRRTPPGAGAALSRTAGERPCVAGERERRRPRAQPLARPDLRRDDLRLHVDRRGQHTGDDRAPARARAGAPSARRRDPSPGTVDGALGGSADHRDRSGARSGDHGHGTATAQPRADGQPPTLRPGRLVRGHPRRLGTGGTGGPRAARRGGPCARAPVEAIGVGE